MKGKRRLQPPGRRSLPSKNVAIAQTYRGQLHWQKWPRKRGKPRHPKLVELTTRFRLALTLAKYADDQAMWMVNEVAKHGPVYPRDLHLAAMYGRLFEVLNTDEGTFHSMALALDISADLDILTNKAPGALLVRGPDRWIALLPGDAGQVLTSNGPDAPATFQPGGGAGSQVYTAPRCANTASGNAFASKGFFIRPLRDYSIAAMTIRVNPGSAGNTWKAAIWQIDSGLKITALLAEPAGQVLATGWQTVTYALDPPAVIAADTPYYFAFRNSSGADTNAIPCARPTASDAFPNMLTDLYFFGGSELQAARLAKANPAIGDTVSASGALECWMGLTVAG